MSAGYGVYASTTDFKFKSFITKRINRIYPLHFLGVIAWMLLFSHALGVKEVLCLPTILNLLLLHALVPSKEYFFSCNGVSWCLSVLLFCYALFPLIIQYSGKLNRKRLLLVFTSLLLLYFCIISFIPNDMVASIIYISPLMRLFDFIIGILCHKVYIHISCKYASSVNEYTTNILQIIVVLFLIGAIIFSGYIPVKIRQVSYWWLPVSFILIVFALFDSRDTIVNRILKSRILIWFGEISFSFYILHQLIIEFSAPYVSRHITVAPLGLCFIFLITILISWLSNKYIEQFLMSYVFKRI